MRDADRAEPPDGPAAENGAVATTVGTLLGGRVVYRQPRAGYRTGIEPVLLAAAVPARPGDTVLEAGCGAGAGLLCLTTRVGGLQAIGLEQDDLSATLAAENLGIAHRFGMAVHRCVLPALPPELPILDHVLFNPPWHRAGATPSVSARRALALQMPADSRESPLSSWSAALAPRLRRGGTLTVVVATARLADAVEAFRAARIGTLRLLPLWPRIGATARLMVLQGRRLGRGDDAVLPGLVLHEASGRYTAAAEAVLRAGTALPGLGDTRSTKRGRGPA
ncbi:tRNA1(Val) (adenine(37)-N6)-methyltransferase [Rhizosaccharibacter radicis]|uniref:Methyltransferase n=1 Tax=Rhizosaccharibacter radicis TaxID=2782605 RepID=A0ABT1VU03_9PROT|nr:methyltransferase [Acetobacteraceae bacterium KSS12]